MYDLGGKRVWVAGHRGMVGSAVVRRLATEACILVTCPSDQLDLRRQEQVEAFLQRERPDAIVLAAARVGGILANDRFPADFLRDNLQIATNVIAGAHEAGVERLLFLGSSCIYPRDAAQPIEAAALLSGPLEPTNQWYAIAKIAGVKLVEAYRHQHARDYIAAMPANLYGPGDNFCLSSGHVLPSLLHRAHLAAASGSEVLSVWGSGKPRREFLHVDDCADALVLLLKHYSSDEPINVGSGDDISIEEVAQLVCRTVGFRGGIAFDPEKPDGTPRKLMNSSRLRAMGWKPSRNLEQGLAETYAWFLQHAAQGDAA